MSRPGKRKGGPQQAASQPAPQRQRRAAQPQQQQIVRMMEAREFWDSIATPFLHAWATDYDTVDARALPEERATLLTWLVETDGVEVPDGDTREKQIAQLRKCYRKRKGGKGRLPPVEAAPELEPLSPNSGSDAEDDGARTPPLAQPMAPPIDAAALAAGHLQQRAAADHRSPSPVASPAPLSQADLAAQIARFAELQARVAPSPGSVRACLTCGVPPPTSAPPVFNCAGCGLRGDVPLEHAANVFLRARLTGPAAPAAAASSAAASSISGQSAPVLKTGLSALDQALSRMLERGVAMPLFSGPSAGDAVSHSEALALTARAYEASKYQPPSEHLIALIRSGKLRDVGYALPRPHQSLAGEQESQAGTMALSGGALQFVNKVPVAPAVASSQQFCMALLSAILPALADRPRAMMEWITLGHTALALEASNGWAVAQVYLQRALAAAIDVGKPFAEEVNPHVLLPIIIGAAALAPPRSHAPGDAPRAAGGGGGGGSGADRQFKACYNWNGNKTCSREPCPFAHVCQHCASTGHRGSACPGTRGGGGSRRAPPGGSSVASRHTRRPPTAAAPAASPSTTA